MLCNVTYPENCLMVEITKSSNTLQIYGEKLRDISTSQATIDLSFQFEVLREYQRERYSPFSGIDDAEQVAHLCRKLQELQKSDAVFKDSVVDFIDILMRGFGTMEPSHHNNILKMNLGCSNAQCQCFNCFEAQNSSIPIFDRDDLNYLSNLFAFDENIEFPQTIFN